MGGANKDEALRCLRIAKEALEAGDEARALRFLSKARRLDASLPVDDLLSSIKGRGGDTPAPPAPEPDDDDKQPKVTSRDSKASPSSPDEPSRAAAYTEEQVTVVRHIKKQTDYYQILGVERSCSVEDVRKAYRKLSLKVHPDKNKAPGAEEAFKAVSKAFQCLSDEERRKTYDIVGSEDPPRINRHAARRRHHGVYRGFDGEYYEADIDAEEIFRNFFFGGMAPTTPFGAYRFRTGGMGGGEGGRHHHNGAHVSGGSNFRILLQVLPVLVLLLLNFLPSHDPPYALSRSYPYEHKLETPRGVPFFVKRGNSFEQDYPFNSAERMKLEESVERDYVGIVSQNCRIELQRQRWGYGNKTPHCDMLRKYEATFAQSE